MVMITVFVMVMMQTMEGDKGLAQNMMLHVRSQEAPHLNGQLRKSQTKIWKELLGGGQIVRSSNVRATVTSNGGLGPKSRLL
jgi:hypothetical protein